jgi:hypothetical protein
MKLDEKWKRQMSRVQKYVAINENKLTYTKFI